MGITSCCSEIRLTGPCHVAQAFQLVPEQDRFIASEYITCLAVQRLTVSRFADSLCVHCHHQYVRVHVPYMFACVFANSTNDLWTCVFAKHWLPDATDVSTGSWTWSAVTRQFHDY